MEPSQGIIPPESYIDFQIIFSPMHAEPYYEYADFIVEDIPISAMQNPPQHLKQFVDGLMSTQSRIPIPTYPGSNTQYMSLPLMHFSLRGQGTSKQI